MKNLLYVLSFAFLVYLAGNNASGQALLYEDFNYTPPAYIGGNGDAGSSSNNWTTHSVTTGQTTTIDIVTGNLSYTGLTAPSGYKVYFFSNSNATSRDVNRAFTPAGSPTVMYYSVLINIIDNTQLSTSFDYFMSFGATSGTSVTSLFGRLHIKSVNSGANFRLGIQNISGTGATQTEYTTDLSFSTTYFIVVKYDLNGTSNDIASLWVNPTSLGGAEPAGAVTNSSSATQPAAFASICLRNNAVSPKADIDEIRIGETWADVTPTGTVSAPTVQASDLTFDNILQTQMDVAWTNGNGAKRIVKINTSNSFANPVNGTDPAANPVYGGSGEQVVYNGSDNTVPTVSGLTSGTTYWFKVFEYNGSGTSTMYCTTAGANNPKSQATASAPVAPIIIEPTVTSITATSAILGGNITSNGGSPITERGTVWSTTSPVTIANNKLAEGGTSTGVFSHLRSSMPPNTVIYYAAYATNAVGTSLTEEDTLTTLLGEPTNHAINFIATAPTYSTVTLTWSDNDGAQPATGFLILGNTTGTFTDPVDGVEQSNDYTLSDGGSVNVAHGVETLTFYSVSSSTPYYFVIYPYTNSDTDIDYKTTPLVPAATVTTPVYIPPLAAWTFDATPAQPNTPTSVAANIGYQSGTAMLYADGTNGSSSWDQATELNAFTGTLLNDPREEGSSLAGMSYCPVGGTSYSANGKSMVIKFSMEDYVDPVMTFATRGTSTGFTTHQWAWSTDNIAYTDFGTNTCNSTTTFLTRTLDMSSIDELDQAVDVYLRITFDGASSASGNNRLDNIVIYASEPSGEPFSLNLKVFLEGPYNTSTNLMATDLLSGGLLPLNQPFNPVLPYYGNNTPKWLYTGTQTVTSFPTGTVDYVLIELRDAANAAAATSATRIAQVPALLKNNGSIVSLNGSLPSFTNTINNLLFIVVWSRNHVGIMNTMGITPSGTVIYDFSTSSAQVYGGSVGYKLLETGVWGMASGDINADGAVNTTDKSPTGWKTDAGKLGFLGSDVNLDKQVTNKDKNDCWLPNNGTKTTQVPN